MSQEPSKSPITGTDRGQPAGKVLRSVVLGLAGIATLMVGALLVVELGRWKSSPANPPPSRLRPDKHSLGSQGSVTVHLAHEHFYPWPPKAVVIGPPIGVPGASSRERRPHEEKGEQATPAAKPGPDPAAPSADELKKESARNGDELSTDDARAMLLDEKRSSALKLAVIDKLRTQAPQEVVPILVAFLDRPAGDSGSYTKPTAIQVLKELHDPAADEALARLAQTSKDERVRLTILALAAKEKTR